MLRGTNLGNWLVQEGYMFKLEHGPQSSREIESLTNELIGPDAAAKFWNEYRDRYITRDDIQFIKQAGFNSIRVPFHYKFFLADDAEGFRLLDRVLQLGSAEAFLLQPLLDFLTRLFQFAACDDLAVDFRGDFFDHLDVRRKGQRERRCHEYRKPADKHISVSFYSNIAKPRASSP